MSQKPKFEENPLKGVQLESPEVITSTNTPEIDLSNSMMGFVTKDIQSKAKSWMKPTDMFKDFAYNQSNPNPLSTFQDNRIKFEDYSIDTSQTHIKLNNGNLVPLYKDYLPNINNQDRLAREQTTSEKWANGINKFFTGVSTTVAGATIGSVYGIFDAIAKGNFQSVFDNDFSRYMDDLNTRMRYELPNYYSSQEQNRDWYKNVFGDGAANFWADKVLGAAAFTVGAIVSEGIWAAATGGASLSTTAARLALRTGRAGKWAASIVGTERVAKAASTYKGWLKAPLYNAYKKTGMLNKQAAIKAAKTAEGLNTVRFLATSSGYEAGVEAIHYKKEAEENFYRDFYEKNGRQPNADEIIDFESKLNQSANAIFGGNMAILSVSNAVMFGSLFNIKSPFKGVTKDINKKLFGIGVAKNIDEAGKVTFEALKPTKNQKIFSGLFVTTKPIATEGLWEEGGQGAISRAAGHWIESSYDPKYNSTTMAIMDAMIEGMAETYGTVEGWEEIGIGAIIGGGASIIQGKGKFKELKEIQEARKYQSELISGMNTFSDSVLAKRMIMNAKIQNAVERQGVAESQGNSVEAELSNQDKFLAEIEFNYSIGEDLEQLKEKYLIALSNVSQDEFTQAGIKNPEEYIETVSNAYNNLVDSYAKNIQFSEAVFGINVQAGTNTNAKTRAQALAYITTVGENASKMMEDTLLEIGEKIGIENERSIRLQSELKRLDKNVRQKIYSRNKKISQLQETQEKLLKKITTLQNAPKEVQGDRQSGEELGQVNQRLIEVQNQLTELESEREQLAQDISQEIARRRGIEANSKLEIPITSEFITGEDLAKIEENLKNIDNIIASYQGSNPKVYRELIALSDYYLNAEKSFLNYQNAAIALSSGNVKIKTKKVGGLLGKLFDRKSEENSTEKEGDFTTAFLTDVVSNYLITKSKQLNNEERFATEETVTDKEANSPITEFLKNSIAEKIRAGERLSRREAKLLSNNKEVIQKTIEEINKQKGNNPKSKVKTTQAEQVLNEKQRLKNRLEEALSDKYFPLAYIGENYEEIVKDKPSKQDIDRYRQLKRNDDRTAEQEIEFDTLTQKLQNWRALDSAVDGAQSLADIINLIEQLETEIEQDQTVQKVTEEYDTSIVDESLGSGSAVVYELAQNTTGNATAKLLKNGKLKLSHIKIQTILDRLGGTYVILSSKGQPIKSKNIKQYGKSGYTFRITPAGSTGSVDFTIIEGNAIEMNQSDFFSMQESLNLYIVDSGQLNWTYKDVYEVIGTEFVEKESDFVDDDIQGDLYSLQQGDEVEFYYDSNDPWNIEQGKLYKQGKITKDEYRNSLKIYLRKNGKNFGTLKAIRESAVDESMLAIRDKAIEVALQGGSMLVGRTTVSQVVLGSPKFIMDGNRKPEEIPFTNRAIEEVVTTGYVLDNEVTLSDKTLDATIDQSFVGKISKMNEGKKIPVAIIKKGAHYIAYPISVVQKENSQINAFNAIMQDQYASETDKVSAINDLLINVGIQPDTYDLVNLSEQEKLERIAEDLENKTVFTSADSLADNYNKQNLKDDATIKIDLEDLNRSISSPKLRIDLDNFKIYEDVNVKYEAMTEIENTLSDLSVEVNSMIMNDYKDSNGDAIENKFTDVYADDSVIKEPQNHLEKMHNVRMLIKAFPLMSPKAKNLLGQGKVSEIKRLIDKIDFIRRQIDTKANREIKNKENELKC